MDNQLCIVHITINHKTHTYLKKNRILVILCFINSDSIRCVLW